MTAYIANHQKKKRIFAKRERRLLHAIRHGLPAQKLTELAEDLRTAKYSVFKCDFCKSNSHQPHKFSLEKMADKNKHVRRWLSMTSDDIIRVYTDKVVKLSDES